MSTAYASADDLRAIGRPLSAEEQAQAEVLLEQASAKLRVTARRYGRDIDAMIAEPDTGADFALAVKSAVVQAVCRALDSVNAAPVASETQSGLGYSAQVTFANPGQALYFLRSELKDLGLMRQVYGAIEVY